MPVNKQRGLRIKQLMQEKKLTREALASETGYSISLITKARNGHDFKTDFQTAVCEVLGTTPNYINGHNDYSPYHHRILDELTRINDPEIEQLILNLLRKY